MRDGDAGGVCRVSGVRTANWRPDKRGGAGSTGGAFAHAGDFVDGDWRVVSDPGGGADGVGSSVHFVLHDREPFAEFFPLLLYIGGGSLLLLGAGGICVGLGLQQRQAWARTAAIVLAVLALFHPPFGTALGVYTLWVLLSDESGEEYRHLSQG